MLTPEQALAVARAAYPGRPVYLWSDRQAQRRRVTTRRTPRPEDLECLAKLDPLIGLPGRISRVENPCEPKFTGATWLWPRGPHWGVMLVVRTERSNP